MVTHEEVIEDLLQRARIASVEEGAADLVTEQAGHVVTTAGCSIALGGGAHVLPKLGARPRKRDGGPVRQDAYGNGIDEPRPS